jgi:hypothetical protein
MKKIIYFYLINKVLNSNYPLDFLSKKDLSSSRSKDFSPPEWQLLDMSITN